MMPKAVVLLEKTVSRIYYSCEAKTAMKIFRKVLFLIFLITGVASAINLNFDEALVEAKQLAAEKKYKEAKEALKTAGLYATASEKPRLHEALGDLYRMAGEIYKAMDEYDEAVALAGDAPCAHAGRALFYSVIGEFGAARSDTEIAVADGCRKPELLMLAGRLRMQVDDPVGAIDYFSQAGEDSGFRFEALREIGGAFMTVGYSETARNYLEEAARISSDDKKLQALLADNYSMLGLFDNAMVHYKRVMEIGGADEVSSNNYGYTLFIMGKAEEALAIFEKLNKTKPTPYSLCNTMEINISKRNRDAANKAGELCLKEIEKDPAFAAYERYYMRAAARAVRLINEEPETLEVSTQLKAAHDYISRGDTTNALSAALVALMINPADPETLFEAGRYYSLLGDTSKAGSMLNLAMTLGGRNTKFYFEARRILFQNAMTLTGMTYAIQDSYWN